MISSELPEFARGAPRRVAAKQTREYGAIRGTRTLPELEPEAAAEPVSPRVPRTC